MLFFPAVAEGEFGRLVYSSGDIKEERDMSDYKKMVSISDYKGTFGAAIGDIYGSYYEFQYGPKTPKADIRIHRSSTYTDDTVLTAAIADWLASRGKRKGVAHYLRKWANKYPTAGFGGMFHHWMFQENAGPYNSFGNGSAMRVSAVAYYAKDLEECELLAKESAEATHNHPEGIKGAVVIAGCIYLALRGASRKEIEEYAGKHYDLDLDFDAMMAEYGHGEEICQVTVPQAIWCFLHSDSFDDCLRLCLMIRWDADTLAAIACPIAEAYYKEIPLEYLLEAKNRLPEDIRLTLEWVRKEAL